MTARPVPYAGVATRAVGLAIDVGIAQLIVFAGAAIFGLVASLIGNIELETTFARVVAACAWAGVVGTYFVLFWSTTGQTPGMRIMGVRVLRHDGRHPGIVRSIVRLIGLGLAILPCFLGFVPALIDERRRALQDFLAGTVVLYAHEDLPPHPVAVVASADVQPSG